MSALTLDSVTVMRGEQTILRDINVIFAAARLTVVIGPNGAGKSTLLETAAGLLAPGTGTVRLGDTALAALSRRALAQRRAYLPQRARVDWPITVERVVALGLTPSLPVFGVMPLRFIPAIARAMADCDLTDLRDRPATSLSGGELARVMLARAIVGDPELLIVDEPTAGLDPRHALAAARRLRACADAGRTVIMAMHEIDLALRFADDVVAVKDGRVLWAGPVETEVSAKALGQLYDIEVRLHRDNTGIAVRFCD